MKCIQTHIQVLDYKEYVHKEQDWADNGPLRNAREDSGVWGLFSKEARYPMQDITSYTVEVQFC